MKENALQNNFKDTITGRDYRFVVLWVAGLILIFVITGYIGVHQLQSYKAQTAQVRQGWMNAKMTGQAEGTSDVMLPNGTKPVDVHVGMYINHIGEFSLKDNTCTADFDVWFSWTGDKVHPGDNFEIVDGEIVYKKKVESDVREGRYYEHYHLKVRILKYIDTSRLPFGDEELAIQIEDGVDNAERLRYIADAQKSGISPQAIRRILKVTESGAWVKLYNYGAVRKLYYRFVYVMLISPLGFSFYVKMFQGLFASVAIAFIALFLKPIHFSSRFSLGVGAFFAVIGNNISMGSSLLVSNRLSLADMAYGIGLMTIFLTLVQSAVTGYFFDTKGQEKLSRFFDKISFVVLLLGYVIVNILLPLVAKS